ncbi:DUF2163 domain-containing protein [Anaplasmataceae bacterium AB001_6]|nr:DUF2163 domain-containing protein [Anaplasmataceae bacterium AB001_6]
MQNIYYTFLITLNNKDVISLTNYNKDLIHKNITYKGKAKLSITNRTQSNEDKATKLIISSIIDSEEIKPEYMHQGLFNNATIFINSIEKSNEIKPFFSGKITQTAQDDNRIKIYAESDIAYLSKIIIGQTISKNCNASLFDSKCTLNRATYQNKGQISKIITSDTFIDSTLSKADGYFNFGEIEFTSGRNKNINFKILRYEKQAFSLSLPIKYELEIGDEFIATAGCNKTIENCTHKFKNNKNFHGFPWIQMSGR